MRTSKGTAGMEFVVATTLFLAAFWFIYIQGALMLMPQLHRGDIRETGINFYSTVLATDTGIPQDWVNNPTKIGFAEYEESPQANILNKTKLDWAHYRECSEIHEGIMAGMEFAFSVTSSAGYWECNTTIIKEGSVKRGVYIHIGTEYYPGVLEVWAA